MNKEYLENKELIDAMVNKINYFKEAKDEEDYTLSSLENQLKRLLATDRVEKFIKGVKNATFDAIDTIIRYKGNYRIIYVEDLKNEIIGINNQNRYSQPPVYSYYTGEAERNIESFIELGFDDDFFDYINNNYKFEEEMENDIDVYLKDEEGNIDIHKTEFAIASYYFDKSINDAIKEIIEHNNFNGGVLFEDYDSDIDYTDVSELAKLEFRIGVLEKIKEQLDNE